MLYYQQNDQEQVPVNEAQILWKPHPGPQTQALTETAFEILYGGARGGGKTDAGIAWLLREAHNPKLRALVIRRNSTDLEDWIDRATLVYAGVGAVKTGNPPRFIFPSGAIIRVGHLKDDAAYTKYIGHEYQRMLIEELTLIPSEDDYLKLLSSCRSTIDGLESRIFCTTNPTGVGHAWVKKRFIDVASSNTLYTDPVTGRTRIFISAKIDDNPTLVTKDPGYIKWLEGLKEKNENLYKAWRYGSWDVFSGQVFSEFRRDLHVIKPFIPKKEFPHFIWIDWGYAGRESHEGAFAAYASALIKASHRGETFNRIITYKEWYGKYKAPDEWAQIIYQDTNGRLFRGGYCDSSMFSTQSSGGISIANLMERKWEELDDKFWLKLYPGTRNRIQRVSTAHNWLQMAPDGLPYWLITENCQNLIRTLPQLVYDEHNPEDVDTSQEDHCYDAATYGLASIKFIPAYLGGIGKPEEKKKALPEPIFALDLSEFEEPIPRQRDWRAI